MIMTNTYDFTPPSSVSVSLKDDDCSCVSDADGDVHCNDTILNLNDTHNVLHRLPSRSTSPGEMNQVVIELLKENQEKEQELIALKLQVAKQEEKIDILSSRLSSRCQVENEYAGETVPDMARDTSLESIDEAPKRQPPRRKMERRFSLSSIGAGLNNSFNRGSTLNSSFSSAPSNTNGSMQMLIDANGKLMQDNKRLEVSVDGLRRSFQSYIALASQSERSDKEAIDRLQREVKTLQCQPDLSETSVTVLEKIMSYDDGNKDKKSSLQLTKQSFATQLTSSLLDDLYKIDKNHDEDYDHEDYKRDENTGDDLYKIDNNTSLPPPSQNSNNDEEDKKSRNTTSSMDNLSRSANTLLVDFGDRTRSMRRRSSMPPRWQSQIVMTNNRSPM